MSGVMRFSKPSLANAVTYYTNNQKHFLSVCAERSAQNILVEISKKLMNEKMMRWTASPSTNHFMPLYHPVTTLCHYISIYCTLTFAP